MKETVVIKLHRPQITCGEYRDIWLDKFAAKTKELKAFAESVGKRVYFTVCENADYADFDCFVEVIYSGVLSETEKKKYSHVIKYFAKDANVENGELVEYDLPVSVLFINAPIETF